MKVFKQKGTIMSCTTTDGPDEGLYRDHRAWWWNRLGNHARLSKNEERLLIMLAQGGCRTSRDRLVEHSMRGVFWAALEYSRRYGVEPDDLIGLGVEGMMSAIEGYDLGTYDNDLLTFAYPKMRHLMKRFAEAQRRSVRVTDYGICLARRIGNMERQAAKAGHDLTDDEGARRLGVRLSTYVRGRHNGTLRVVSTEDRLSNRLADSGLTVGDILVAGKAEDGQKQEALDAVRAVVNRYLHRMNAKEVFLLERRLMAAKPMTLTAIAAQFKVSRERIRQLEARLIGRLKFRLEAYRRYR
jgi:RNA polymerase sigma-32 factor